MTPSCSPDDRYTLANPPGTDGFSNITETEIQANWTANGNPAGTEYYCENTTVGTNSGWTTEIFWNSMGLDCDISYSFRVKARNGEHVETAWTDLGEQSTEPCPTCEGDFDEDGDVDGSDLAVFAADGGGTTTLAQFAADFGRTDCLE